jgi:D-threonate/D-erythronate kinase
MIAVIADDFTGAAEIGGIGLRHGLKVLIETEVNNPVNVDLLIIATDTRSMDAIDAANYISGLTRKLLQLSPAFIYKKIDSVLRGNIACEISAQMQAMGRDKALIIAGNPVFNRIIRYGEYTINGIPLNETSFAHDPESPINSVKVDEIIGKNGIKVYSGITSKDVLPDKGLVAGDVCNFGDLESWTKRIDDSIVVAGASGFFDAILKNLHLNSLNSENSVKLIGEPSLFVLGSAFNKNDNFFTKISQKGYYLSNMPEEIYFNKNYPPAWIDFWVDDIVAAFEKNIRVFASVSHTISNEPGISTRIKETLGIVINKVVNKIHLEELIIEGGGTTSVILDHLKVKKLKPIQELETGIIRMEMEGLPGTYLTTKPGSYQWPKELLIPERDNAK